MSIWIIFRIVSITGFPSYKCNREIRNIEKGTSLPRVNNLRELAEVFNYSLDELVDIDLKSKLFLWG
ncbi:helix-turn-helix transcriptional regulator [Prolixibacter sp. SD074]|uniref:helix-turn-helix domain-containing protein n=1 Tax=Prolixibacter sp. SD074 TaxID=2652391 RepID=UPI001298F75E